MDNRGSGGGFIAIGVIIAGMIALKFTLPSVFSVVKWIGIIALIVIVAVIVLVIVFASKVSIDEVKEKKSMGGKLSDENAEILSKGRKDLMTLRRSVLGIKNIDIRKKGNDICASIDKIIQTLKDKPEKIQSARRVFNYYLPTLGDVLSKYRTLENNGIPGDEKLVAVGNCLDDIKAAMDKLYSNLFESDILDMTVDIEAMKLAVKRDGLSDRDMSKDTDTKDEEKSIKLTL